MSRPQKASEDAVRYRITSVPELSEIESVAVVLALVRLGELPPPAPGPPRVRQAPAPLGETWTATT